MKNESGFTLIEMMIVLVVISILLLVTIPNITKHNSKINTTGCEALTKMVQAEVQSFFMEHREYPKDMDALVDEQYIISEQKTCPNGSELILTNGLVTVSTDE
ncbi:competence type IV pilus major pilin ComGC [Bacillus sp. B1-b2]|uniref:competence type IV pilus major pilin ComGC n=1 Tax=Bacillus sp. B1-b2 TaxID=2653201 RepID=UPI0012626B3F|nr:competence type IV pilus major pilin ComGC [Bacillus sp. B1-b2]KAB7670019.1 prepilin-type N-terminal cleavage/methylation domain-containing protein [Bacillus sp. B1-b2]